MPAEGVPTAVDERKIIRWASIEVVVPTWPSASDLRAVAAGVGGMVTAERLPLPEDASTPTQDSSLVVVSVPSGQLERALTLIAEIGEVQEPHHRVDRRHRHRGRHRVQDKTMRESIARLQELMSKAGSVSDIAKVEIRAHLATVRTQALLARLNTLNRQVELSAHHRHPPHSGHRRTGAVERLPAGLQAGWESPDEGRQWLLTALGVLLPYLGVAAVVGVPLVLWRRHRSRQRCGPRPRNRPRPWRGTWPPAA